MNIKIECPCETRFAFDVEPEDGRMPVAVQCPGCGADSTELANQVIERRLADAPMGVPDASAAPKLRISRSQSPAVHEPEPGTSSPASTATGPGMRFCLKHNQRTTDTCRVCGKPICPECMAVLGYLCSGYCQEQADVRGIELPVYEHRRLAVMAHGQRNMRLAIRYSFLAALLLVGGYAWYSFSGSHPKLFLVQPLNNHDSSAQVKWLSPDRLLIIEQDTLRLFNVSKRQDLWSVSLNAAPRRTDPANEETPGAGRSSSRRWMGAPEYNLFLAAGDVWVATPARLMRLDPATGAVKAETPLNGELNAFSLTDWAATLTFTRAAGGLAFVEVNRETGEARTIDSESSAPRFGRGDFETASGQLFVTGGGTVQFTYKLLEKRSITREGMKATAGVVDSKKFSGTRSDEAVQDLLNEMQRESGDTTVSEDVSRYGVTLHRVPAGTASDWTGEVIGSPDFFALKTVDVLTGGKEINVFDKRGRKLWAAPLSYAISRRFGQQNAAPFLEHRDLLFVWDVGMLAAFRRADGQAVWRFATAGISEVIVGVDGKLLVSSTTASPDSLRYSKQVRMTERDRPVILKVDPKDGRVLWQTENQGDNLHVSGKYIYTDASSVSSFAALISQTKERMNFNLRRLNPGNGRVLWTLYHEGRPTALDVLNKRIVLVLDKELRFYRYLSL